MTANSATSSATFMPHRQSSHRQSPGRQSSHRAGLAGDGRAQHRGPFLLPDTRGGGPRGPHPGDVLYWVACLGGACLLLLAATT